MHTSTGSTVSSALRSETHEQRRAGWPVAEAFIGATLLRGQSTDDDSRAELAAEAGITNTADADRLFSRVHGRPLPEHHGLNRIAATDGRALR